MELKLLIKCSVLLVNEFVVWLSICPSVQSCSKSLEYILRIFKWKVSKKSPNLPQLVCFFYLIFYSIWQWKTYTYTFKRFYSIPHYINKSFFAEEERSYILRWGWLFSLGDAYEEDLSLALTSFFFNIYKPEWNNPLIF